MKNGCELAPNGPCRHHILDDKMGSQLESAALPDIAVGKALIQVSFVFLLEIVTI